MKNIVYKSLDFDIKSIEDVGEQRKVCAYASTWDYDLEDERFDPKAFDDSIINNFDIPMSKKGSGNIRLLREHNKEKVIGRIDVLRVDEKGLYFECYISKTFWGEDTYVLLKDKAIDKVSLGFSIQNEFMDKQYKIILKARIWEISFVAIPANEETDVTEVKAMSFDFEGVGEQLKAMALKLDELAQVKSAQEIIINLIVNGKKIQAKDYGMESDNPGQDPITVMLDELQEEAAEEIEGVCDSEQGEIVTMAKSAPFSTEQMEFLMELMAPKEAFSEPVKSVDAEPVAEIETEIKSTEDKKEELVSQDEITQLQNELKSLGSMFTKILNKEKKNG